MSDRLLTLKETADYLKVHYQTVRSYIAKNQLQAVKVGRNIRIKESDIERFLEKKSQEKDLHEIEIRFVTKNRKKLEETLVKLGAKVIYQGHVIDHWFVPTWVKNIEQKNNLYESGRGFGLRIRERDDGYTGRITTSLEIKNLVIPYKHDTCIEQDILVSNYEEARRLLSLMKFKEIVALNKDRIIYQIDGVKVIIDDIEGFKIGVEIEMITDKDRKVIIPKLVKTAEKLGLDIKKEITDKSVTFLYMQEFAKF